jgi:hypothetical protein
VFACDVHVTRVVTPLGLHRVFKHYIFTIYIINIVKCIICSHYRSTASGICPIVSLSERFFRCAVAFLRRFRSTLLWSPSAPLLSAVDPTRSCLVMIPCTWLWLFTTSRCRRPRVRNTL